MTLIIDTETTKLTIVIRTPFGTSFINDFMSSVRAPSKRIIASARDVNSGANSFIDARRTECVTLRRIPITTRERTSGMPVFSKMNFATTPNRSIIPSPKIITATDIIIIRLNVINSF